MSHKGIRSLIEDVSKSLGNDIQFTYARTSDFNLLRDKRYPFISCDPITAAAVYTDNNVSNYMKTWSCQMAFYQLDKEGSDQDEYKLILDFTDDLVDKFINKMNFYAFGACVDSDDIIITGINQTPFVKATSDILTGHILSFQVQVTDQFNYCGLGC